ncbi:hypothetical protein Vadar_005563 [Vaccinium darrowii]|uniref:Uncharacterized protein n=1 Tax=Vaccinium darrowii TaxID=229202 RepID=A0ACB7WY10_9ERIC|nr:hypothetical protein Vadar_005563 [Vaccinium darrowii]
MEFTGRFPPRPCPLQTTHVLSQPRRRHRILSKFSGIDSKKPNLRKDFRSKTINFSYSPAISRANSSLTGKTDKKQAASSSAFVVSNLS